MNDLNARITTIETRDDLVAFLRALRKSLAESPDKWENTTLEAYLEAVAAWTEDMDGYFVNQGMPAPKAPTWRLIAQILMAASVYE